MGSIILRRDHRVDGTWPMLWKMSKIWVRVGERKHSEPEG